MKKFSYTWDDTLYLLHIQINKGEGKTDDVSLTREYDNGKTNTEVIQMKNVSTSHRFIVSRSHPKELSFSIEYPDDFVLEAYKIDDRAYYPTEAFFIG